MYIYLQYHGKYTKDIGTTVYILDPFFFLFKTFDSCVYVTEVSFHWFLSYGQRLAFFARESDERSTLGKLIHIDSRRGKLAKTYAPYRASFSQKSTPTRLRAFKKHALSITAFRFGRNAREYYKVHAWKSYWSIFLRIHCEWWILCEE